MFLREHLKTPHLCFGTVHVVFQLFPDRWFVNMKGELNNPYVLLPLVFIFFKGFQAPPVCAPRFIGLHEPHPSLRSLLLGYDCPP